MKATGDGVATFLAGLSSGVILAAGVVALADERNNSVRKAECIAEYSYTQPIPDDRFLELVKAVRACD